MIYKTRQPFSHSHSSPFSINHTLNLQSNNFTKPINTKSIIMDSVKQAGNFVSDKVQQAAHGTSKEANKEVAKDSNAPIGTRYAFPSFSLMFSC